MNPDHDRRLFIALASVLTALGVLMVHSASITARPTDFEQVYLSRHLRFLVLGIGLASIAAFMPVRFWRRAAPWLFLGTIVLLVLVLVPGIGTRVKGAQRWLRYGSISLQPSEAAKVALPLCVCWLADRRRDLLRSWIAGPVLYSLPVVMVAPLVFLQPDLGTALFLVLGAALALFIAGLPLRNFMLAGLAAIPLLGSLVWLHPYQMRRITGFLTAWRDWTEAPYQLRQSLVSLGAGGLWGMGLGRGWQKLSFLPEANTDFVFAVIGEELGLLGTLTVVILWGGLYACGLRMLSRVPQKTFAYTAAYTLLTQLVIQAALNVAVVTALVPPKGISHPLISYGGSNLVMSLIALGLIVGLTRPEPETPLTSDYEPMR